MAKEIQFINSKKGISWKRLDIEGFLGILKVSYWSYFGEVTVNSFVIFYQEIVLYCSFVTGLGNAYFYLSAHF